MFLLIIKSVNERNVILLHFMSLLISVVQRYTAPKMKIDCLKKFASSDFIMEPEIFSQLKKYFQAGGNPEQVIDLLSKNYIAVAQMANLMAEWLILAGAEINEVQQQVENHLHDMILKTFDPKKADAIFAEEGETPSWLAELIGKLIF